MLVEEEGPAVVLGAIGGLGGALVELLARAWRPLAIADIDEPSLAKLAERLSGAGVTVHAERVDVSRPDEVAAFATRAQVALGPPQLVVNAVGVTVTGMTWELTRADWDWIMAVNFGGALNVTESFLPQLMARGRGILAHASSTTAVLPPVTSSAPYLASKHAILGLCEGVQQDLRLEGSGVTVSVILPGTIRSRMASAERNRQSRFGPPRMGADEVARLQSYLNERGADALVVATRVLSQLREGRFYVFGDPADAELVATRFDGIRSGVLAPPPPLGADRQT